jgi:hypothetical protein
LRARLSRTAKKGSGAFERGKKGSFAQRRKDAKKARKGLERLFNLKAFFMSSLRLCVFAGDSFIAKKLSEQMQDSMHLL